MKEVKLHCTPEDVLSFIGKLFSWSWWKYGLAGAVAAGVNFVKDAPNLWADLAVALVVLMILDMILGIWASMSQGHKLSSCGFQRAILKLVLYLVVFIVSAIVDHLFELPYTFSFLVLSLCVIREGTSVGENSRSLWEKNFPDKPFPFSFVFDKLSEVNKRLPQNVRRDDDEGE